MLVAHEFLLLVLNDETGRIQPHAAAADAALAGALLIDLTSRGFVGLTSKQDRGRKGRLVVRSLEFPPEPVLQQALGVVHNLKGRRPRAAILQVAKGVRDQLAAELAHAGILRHEPLKLLGLFTLTRWPVVDTAAKTELRRRISRVLSGSAQPDSRTGPLIALLYALGAVTSVIPVPDKRAATRRAKEIAYGPWAADPVQAMYAAVVATVTHAKAAESSGGG
jgi:hypothetical protein